MNFPDIAGFEFKALINAGDTLITWKAIQQSLDREIDVRVLNPALDSAHREHFLKIARAVSRATHVNIAQIVDIVTSDGHTYLLQEHVEGSTLSEMVAATGGLSTSQILRLAEQLAEALGHLWKHTKIVVRNLKPQNIRLNQQGALKLSEFSLAIIADDPEPTAIDGGNIVGTPHYISPEQARGDTDIDHRSDIYAFGTIVYFLATGKSPFEGNDHYEILERQINAKIAHPRNLNAQLPPAICNFIAKLLMKDRQERYQDWAAIIKDIHRLERGLNIVHPPSDFSGSTIDSFAGTGPKVQKGIVSGKAAKRIRENRKLSEIPSFVRTPLWILLVVWLVYLANQRLENPLRLPAQWLITKVEINDIVAKFTTDEDIQADEDEQDNVITRLVDDSNEDDTGIENGYADDQPEDAPEPGYARETATAMTEEDAVPDAPPIRSELAPVGDSFKRGDIATAIEQLQNLSKEPNDQYAQMILLLRQAPDPALLLVRGLQQNLGKTITIKYMGRQRNITPVAVDNAKVQADFTSAQGTRHPITLEIAKLDPAEHLDLLPEPETIPQNVAYTLMALKARNNYQFNRLKNNTGALQPLFLSIHP